MESPFARPPPRRVGFRYRLGRVRGGLGRRRLDAHARGSFENPPIEAPVEVLADDRKGAIRRDRLPFIKDGVEQPDYVIATNLLDVSLAPRWNDAPAKCAFGFLLRLRSVFCSDVSVEELLCDSLDSINCSGLRAAIFSTPGSRPSPIARSAARARLRASTRLMDGKEPRVGFLGWPLWRYRKANDFAPLGCTTR